MSNPVNSDGSVEPPTIESSTRSILISLATSLVLAIIALVGFVMPAEYGIDPIGVGKLTGIQKMSGYTVNALAIEPTAAQQDSIEFQLEPFESIEYKYILEQGQALIYQWQADAEVVFDFHSEEEGTNPEDAVSFSVGRGALEQGTYVAPYAGVHGWFWENRGDQMVTVKLVTTGFYSRSITYSPSGEYKRDF